MRAHVGSHLGDGAVDIPVVEPGGLGVCLCELG